MIAINKKKIFRYSILVFFLVLFTIFSLRHFILGGKNAASVDALCPFGGIESLWTFISTGIFVPRVMASSLILAIGLIITAILFRRGFCGWVCPFGTLQELLGKAIKKKVKVPQKIDRYARYVKYLVLAAIIIGTAATGALVFRAFDPFVSFFHFGKGILWEYNPEEIGEALVGFGIMLAVLASAVFIERAWCRYLCPLGATMIPFSWFGASTINRNSKCIDCKVCDKVCPASVKVSTIDKVKDTECISCMQCVDKCPKNALEIKVMGKKVNTFVYAFGLIGVFFAVIGLAMFIGTWQSLPVINDENISEKFNPDSIYGWMTLEEVSKASGVSTDCMITELNLPKDMNTSLALNAIGKTYGFSFHTEQVKQFLKEYVPGEEGNEENGCPWHIVNDSAPGDCGLYRDSDENDICDLSE